MKQLAEILDVAVEQLRRGAVEIEAVKEASERLDRRFQLLTYTARLASAVGGKAPIPSAGPRSLLDALERSGRLQTHPEQSNASEGQETEPDDWMTTP